MNQIDDSNSQYLIYDKIVLSRYSRLDGPVQNVVQASFRQAVLYHAHDPKLVGHPGRRRLYNTVIRLFNWLHIAETSSRKAGSILCQRVVVEYIQLGEGKINNVESIDGLSVATRKGEIKTRGDCENNTTDVAENKMAKVNQP